MTEQEFRLFLAQKLTEIGAAMMTYYCPCDLQGGACRAGDPNPCCINSQFGKGLCPFMAGGVCQFPNPGCKLWLCQTAVNATDTRCVEALKLLERVGRLYDLVRSPLIGEPYKGADRQ